MLKKLKNKAQHAIDIVCSLIARSICISENNGFVCYL
jgi:hypothetical protein